MRIPSLWSFQARLEDTSARDPLTIIKHESIIIIIIIWTLQYEHEMYDKFGVRDYQYIKW